MLYLVFEICELLYWNPNMYSCDMLYSKLFCWAFLAYLFFHYNIMLVKLALKKMYSYSVGALSFITLLFDI